MAKRAPGRRADPAAEHIKGSKTTLKVFRHVKAGSWNPVKIMGDFLVRNDSRVVANHAMHNHIAHPKMRKFLRQHTNIRIIHLRRGHLRNILTSMSIKRIIKIAITSILLIGIIVVMGGVEKVLTLLAGMKISYVLLILILHTTDRAIMTYKWLRLLRIKNIHIGIIQGIKIYCASMIWGIFLPSTIGSDAIRVISVTRRGHPSKEVLASVVIERIVGFLSAVLLGIFSCILISRLTNLGPKFQTVFWMGCIVLLVGGAVFALSFSQRFFDLVYGKLLRRFSNTKIIQKLKNFHISYKEFNAQETEMIIFAGLTFLEQLFPIFITWLIALGLGISVDLLFIAGVLPLTLLVSRLPVSINGIGVFESVFALLLSLAGVTTSQAVAIAFAGRILQTVAWLPWWIAQVLSERDLKPPRQVMEKG